MNAWVAFRRRATEEEAISSTTHTWDPECWMQSWKLELNFPNPSGIKGILGFYFINWKLLAWWWTQSFVILACILVPAIKLFYSVKKIYYPYVHLHRKITITSHNIFYFESVPPDFLHCRKPEQAKLSFIFQIYYTFSTIYIRSTPRKPRMF